MKGERASRLLAVPAMQRRIALALGMLLVALLAPLPWLGDLRAQCGSYLLLITSATVALYAGIWLLGRINAPLTSRAILAVAIVLRLAMLPMPPSLSDDAYRYLWDGRLLLHGVNPYSGAPASMPARFHDELLRVQGYPTTNTIYPPGAQLLFASSMAFGELLGSTYGAGYIIFKLMIIASEIAAIWLLLKLLALHGLPPRAALIYAWHPLVIVELAGQGHTDAFWTLSLALALYGYATATSGGGMLGLGLGAALRLYPLPLMPLWARFLGWRASLRGVVIALPALLLFVALLDPASFTNYTTVLRRFTNFYEFNGGFYYAVKGMLDVWHVKPSNVIAGSITTATQLLLLGAVLLWPVRDRSTRALARRALLAITPLITLGAKVHIWYFVAPLFLLPLLDRRMLTWAWLWAALAGPFTYLMYAGGGYAERYDIVAIEWGGVAVAAVAEMVMRREDR
jgi:hypothetical protein